MRHNIPFSALKKIWHWYCGKQNKLKSGLSWSVVFSTTSMRHYSFPKHFSLLLLHVERVRKVSESKVQRVQVAHLYHVVIALSSPSQWNLTKISFIFFWYCGKKTNWMPFSAVCMFIDNNTCHHIGQNCCGLMRHRRVSFDVSNITISHYECIAKIYKMFGYI